MPTEGIEPFARMAVALGLVAGVAVPVGVIGWRLGRRAVGSPLLPAPTADDPLIAFGYLVLFAANLVGVALLGQAAEAAGLPQRAAATTDAEFQGVWRSLCGSLLVAPMVAAVWLVFCRSRRPVATWRGVGWAVAGGVGGWLVASPPVYAVNGVADWASSLAGVVPQEHPLVKVVAAADASRAAVLFAAVAVTTPFAEEVLFRGLLLGWLIRRPGWVAMPVGVAALLTVGTTAGLVRQLALGFLVVLILGLIAVRGRPAVAAVWSTATLFAMVHASVWPTPVPLFLLGLVLGAVAVRTGGVLAGTVLHGLFNAVSLVYLLRG